PLMRSTMLITLLAVGSISLSACGQSPGCRAVTGAGIGAAGGAVLGAIGGNPLLGAAAGAVAGGAVGGLATPNQINAVRAPCNWTDEEIGRAGGDSVTGAGRTRFGAPLRR